MLQTRQLVVILIEIGSKTDKRHENGGRDGSTMAQPVGLESLANQPQIQHHLHSGTRHTRADSLLRARSRLVFAGVSSPATSEPAAVPDRVLGSVGRVARRGL